MQKRRKPKRGSPKSVRRLPDLDHSKVSVLQSLGSPASKRTYGFAIADFICWSSQIDVSSVQAGDARTQMVITDSLTDVELVDLDAMYFVSLHRHVRSPSLRSAGRCRREGRRT